MLEIANISEDIEFLRVAVPARIKGEDVLFEGETAEGSEPEERAPRGERLYNASESLLITEPC